MTIINDFAIFFTCIAIHELGHIVAYIMFGFNPDIKFKWYGVLIGEDIVGKIPLWKIGIIYNSGILAGLSFLLWYNNEIWNLLYIIMCFIDIMGIFQILQAPKGTLNLTVDEYSIYQAKKILGLADLRARLIYKKKGVSN